MQANRPALHHDPVSAYKHTDIWYEQRLHVPQAKRSGPPRKGHKGRIFTQLYLLALDRDMVWNLHWLQTARGRFFLRARFCSLVRPKWTKFDYGVPLLRLSLRLSVCAVNNLFMCCVLCAVLHCACCVAVSYFTVLLLCVVLYVLCVLCWSYKLYSCGRSYCGYCFSVSNLTCSLRTLWLYHHTYVRCMSTCCLYSATKFSTRADSAYRSIQ